MKRFISLKSLLAALLVFVAANVSAYDIKVNGICYNVNLDDMTATVTYCIEDNRFVYYSGDIVIPENVTYNGRTFTVVTIGTQAFSGSDNLRSVIIPQTVKVIEHHAFDACTKLEKVVLQNGLETIGTMAFGGCAFKTIDLPSSLKSIGGSVFHHSALERITIPQSVVSLEGTFLQAYDLKEVILEDGPNSILFKDLEFGSCAIENFYWGRQIISKSSVDNMFEYLNNAGTLKYLTIGKDVISVTGVNLANCKIDEITCYSTKPSYLSIAFSNYTYTSAQLYIPKGTKELYLDAESWWKFVNIQEKELSTDIGNVQASDAVIEVARYSIDGRRLSAPQKGVNIVVMSDGSKRKVMVK